MAVDNRAFDVTPAALVTAIITEEGVFRPDQLGSGVTS
jgi:methylthioribose-1-phosphate isomerase